MTASPANAPLHTPEAAGVAEAGALLAGYPLPELAGRRLFITGGTGFVGHWLLCALAALNAAGGKAEGGAGTGTGAEAGPGAGAGAAGIRATLLSRDPERFLAAHPFWRAASWLEFVGGDMRDYAAPHGHFDAFIHGAADTAPAACRDPASAAVIADGTRRVLAHARAAGASRLLAIGSGAVYGEPPADCAAFAEEHAAADPLAGDGYTLGKREQERLVFAANASAGAAPALVTVVARGFSFVGARLPRHLAISRFIADALADRDIVITGDGRPLRSFLYGADMAIWLLALLARGRGGCAYNVGSPQAQSLLAAATLVRDTLAPARRVVVLGRNEGAPRQCYIPDTRRCERELGLACWTPPAAAIAQTAAALRAAASISGGASR